MSETKELTILGDDTFDPKRRSFMRTAAAGAALAAMSGCNMDDFFRRHFNELSKDDLAAVLAKVQRRNLERFGKQTTVDATGARAGVEFAYGLDLSRCVGCRRCVYACVKETTNRASTRRSTGSGCWR